jgi:acyl-CoA thioesterase-1
VNRLSARLSLSGIAFIALAILALSVPIAGCKDSRSDVEQPSSTASAPTPQPAANVTPATSIPTPTPRDTRPLLLCFGDSLTAGYGTEQGESYPDDLQHLLDKAGYNYHVVNFGISGDTTKDGLDRIARVIARHPQLVVVEFGGNDGLRGLPLDQTKANLDSIIQQLQSTGTQVVLAGITLPPDYGPDYIKKFDAMYPALAKKYQVRFIPFLLKNVYNVPGDMQPDDTHATAKGNRQVAQNVQALIKPLLKK